MKQAAALTFATVLAACGHAASHAQSMKGMEPSATTQKGTSGTTHHAVGVVRNVDPKRGVVTLEHGPVNTLNWPPMTMDFRVRDKAGLAALKPGQKVEFDLVEEQKGNYVINRIK
jgi:Cu/Ag efflux protein CusF